MVGQIIFIVEAIIVSGFPLGGIYCTDCMGCHQVIDHGSVCGVNTTIGNKGIKINGFGVDGDILAFALVVVSLIY